VPVLAGGGVVAAGGGVVSDGGGVVSDGGGVVSDGGGVVSDGGGVVSDGGGVVSDGGGVVSDGGGVVSDGGGSVTSVSCCTGSPRGVSFCASATKVMPNIMTTNNKMADKCLFKFKYGFISHDVPNSNSQSFYSKMTITESIHQKEPS
jgi:hypothetical protein